MNSNPARLDASLMRMFQFNYRNWDALAVEHPPFLLEPFCLSAAEHPEIISRVERLHAATREVRNELAGDRNAMQQLGVDDWTCRIIEQERAASGQSSNAEIARYDFFKTVQGWKISEINNDVPSGFNESSCLEQIMKMHPPAFPVSFPPNATEGWVAAIRQLGLRSLALVYGTAYAEDLQVCLFLKDRFEAAGINCVLASPAHLRMKNGRPCFWGEPVDGIYRFYPVEWFSSLPNRADWEELLRQKIPLFNPFGTILSQSKKFFALLHHNGAVLLNRYFGGIQDTVPKTFFFRPDQMESYLTGRERWVLKPVFGRMGAGIVLGKFTSEDAWKLALLEAAKMPEQFILQEYFEAEIYAFEAGRLYVCIGVYVINGRFAGYFTRASVSPLTTYEAMDAATVTSIS